MPELRPAYLIHGDDHGAISERRARLRRLAEAAGGAGGVETIDGESSTPEGVVLAMSAMTMSIGWRVIIVDGAERFKDGEVRDRLSALLADMPQDTTVAFFAREDNRLKAPPGLHEAVNAAGGQVVQEATIKPWELPRWVRAQAQRMGLSLDAAAAKALVDQVGDRQQRLLRELEKLGLEADEQDGAPVISASDIEQRAAHSTEWRAFALADALVGADGASATQHYLRLRAQGERLPGLMYLMASRLREAIAVAARLAGGESEREIKRGLRMPGRAADRFLADVRLSDELKLQRALGVLADLELDSRGGAPVHALRSALAGSDEDTLAVSAIAEIAADG
jgi:DNA polymerase-3 subunit delta